MLNISGKTWKPSLLNLYLRYFTFFFIPSIFHLLVGRVNKQLFLCLRVECGVYFCLSNSTQFFNTPNSLAISWVLMKKSYYSSFWRAIHIQWWPQWKLVSFKRHISAVKFFTEDILHFNFTSVFCLAVAIAEHAFCAKKLNCYKPESIVVKKNLVTHSKTLANIECNLHIYKCCTFIFTNFLPINVFFYCSWFT